MQSTTRLSAAEQRPTSNRFVWRLKSLVALTPTHFLRMRGGRSLARQAGDAGLERHLPDATWLTSARVFKLASCAVSSAPAAGTFTSGLTPIPSQSPLVRGSTARLLGTNTEKCAASRMKRPGWAPPRVVSPTTVPHSSWPTQSVAGIGCCGFVLTYSVRSSLNRYSSRLFAVAQNHTLGRREVRGEPLGHVHRAVLATGAAQRHSEVAAVVGLKRRQPLGDEVADIGQ